MFDHALAYLDPGSGSLLIQVLIATVVAVPYFLRTQLSRLIAAVLGRRKASEPPVEPETTPPPGSV